jgi:hypothetical protein
MNSFSSNGYEIFHWNRDSIEHSIYSPGDNTKRRTNN